MTGHNFCNSGIPSFPEVCTCDEYDIELGWDGCDTVLAAADSVRLVEC